MNAAKLATLHAQLPPSAHECFQRQRKTLSSRYFVPDARSGKPVPFAMQRHHEEVFRRIHAGYRNHVVLEGGDVRMEAFLVLLMLDMCISQDSFGCALLGAAPKPLRDQLHFIAAHSPAVRDRLATSLGAIADQGCKFKNGSWIRIHEPGHAPASRFNLLTDAAHLAEEEPKKFADTIASLAHPSQHGINVVLASPHGYDNGFSQMLRRSMELAEDGELELFDWAPLFAAWHQHPGNVVEVPGEMARYQPDAKQEAYFARVEASEGLRLSPAQRAWWVSQQQRGVVGPRSSMQARCPLTLEEALAPDSDGLILRREMLALREEGRLVDGLEPSASAPSYVFWNFGGRYCVHAFIVVQPRLDQPDGYQVVYAYQEANVSLRDCLDHLDALKLDAAHHFLPVDQVLGRNGGLIYCHNSYKGAFHAAGIRDITLIERIHDRGAGFAAAAMLAASVLISQHRAIDLFDALYGVQRAYDPGCAVARAQLKLTGAALRNTFLYECFELAARAIQEKALDPEPVDYFAKVDKKDLKGVYVY